MTEDEIKMIDTANANSNLELYGTFSFENLRNILGNDAITNILVKKGFVDATVIPMSGITGGTHSLCTLNQRWRDLKRCGNYNALINYENEFEIKKEQKIKLEFELLKSQNDFQKLNNEFIAKQTELITNQIETNKNAKITNRLIAVFTYAAAVWYLRDVIKGILLDYFPKDALHLDKLTNCASISLDLFTAFILFLGTVFVLRIFQVKKLPEKQTTTT